MSSNQEAAKKWKVAIIGQSSQLCELVVGTELVALRFRQLVSFNPSPFRTD